MILRSDSVKWNLLLLFVFFLPLSAYLSTKLLVGLFLISILFKRRSFHFFELFRDSWDIIIYMLLLILGLIYSENLDLGFRSLETSFAFIALPIIRYQLADFDKQRVDSVFKFFVLGVIVASIICSMAAVNRYLTESQFSFNVFFYYDFTGIIGSHPTYFAYYLIFVITYGLYVINYEKQHFPISAIIGFVLFSFCILLLTGGQTAFVAIIFVFAFFILKFFLGQNNYRHRITLGFVSVMLGTILFVSSSESLQRDQELTDSWDRFNLWRSAILANSDPILGVGTGDSKNELNEYFLETQQDSYAAEGLNAHNQFIQILFSNGIFGLLSVLILILRPLYLAFKNNDQMGILMIFPFLIYGITEVFLGRYQGVVFFALLHQVFISHYLSNKKPTEMNGVLA